MSLTAVVAVFTVFASAAAAKDFKWRGHAPLGDPQWSNGANWQGGAAPSGSVGTLTFPKLGGGCSVTQSPTTCYGTTNDLVGLSAQALSLEDSQGYTLSGNAITLGAGGLTAAPAMNQCSPCGFTAVLLPIALGADQAWSFTAPSGTTLAMDDKVRGETHALHIDVGSGIYLFVKDIEAGPVTITGNAPNAFATPYVVLDTHGSQTTELNGVDRKPVHVTDTYFQGSRTAVGPVTATNAVLLGTGGAHPGRMSVNGGVSLDSRSEVIGYISHSGGSAGKDYWQLSALGPVKLGKSTLILDASTSQGFGANQPCPNLKRGTVETLIKTKGSLTGRFAHLRNKAKIQVDCVGTRPTLRIRYKKHAVTAKAL